jgi:uncharacterized membrane protein YqgA involved in biofilm formation
MIGTIVNTVAVISGSLIGLSVKSKLPEKYINTIFQAIGLFTIVVGVSMSLKSGHLLIILLSLIFGVIIGEAFNLENKVQNLSNWLKRKIKSKDERFTEGLITAFLLYCVGTLTVVGAIEEGLGQGNDLLMMKSVMDGISSIALASALGMGVMVSALPLFILQGGITLFAGFFHEYLTTAYINELSATGGIILVGLGINLLRIKEIKVLNMIPALLVVPLITWIFIYFGALNS